MCACSAASSMLRGVRALPTPCMLCILGEGDPAREFVPEPPPARVADATCPAGDSDTAPAGSGNVAAFMRLLCLPSLSRNANFGSRSSSIATSACRPNVRPRGCGVSGRETTGTGSASEREVNSGPAPDRRAGGVIFWPGFCSIGIRARISPNVLLPRAFPSGPGCAAFKSSSSSELTRCTSPPRTFATAAAKGILSESLRERRFFRPGLPVLLVELPEPELELPLRELPLLLTLTLRSGTPGLVAALVAAPVVGATEVDGIIMDDVERDADEGDRFVWMCSLLPPNMPLACCSDKGGGWGVASLPVERCLLSAIRLSGLALPLPFAL